MLSEEQKRQIEAEEKARANQREVDAYRVKVRASLDPDVRKANNKLATVQAVTWITRLMIIGGALLISTGALSSNLQGGFTMIGMGLILFVGGFLVGGIF